MSNYKNERTKGAEEKVTNPDAHLVFVECWREKEGKE